MDFSATQRHHRSSVLRSSDLRVDLLLHFAPELEHDYRRLQNQHAAHGFRHRAAVIFVLYLVLSTGIASLLPAAQLMPWLTIYGWVAVIIVTAAALSYLSELDGWFGCYLGISSALAVTLALVASSTIQGEHGDILLHVAIMYTLMIVYGFTGLSFYTVTLAAWAGGLLGVLLSQHVDGVLNWQLLLRTYGGPSLLGMCLAYAADHRSRLNFLQARALAQAYQDAEEKNKLLENLSHTDALTGLYNRRYLDEVMQHEWNRALRQQQPLALLMIDIDYFKCYNDCLGHPAGDVCLRQVAQQISQMARRSGDLAARYGGEEFVLLYPATNASQALGLARELLAQMQQAAMPHPDSRLGAAVSLSIGVAVVTPLAQGLSAVGLLEYADQALYQAKLSGRNRAVLFGLGESYA